MRRHRNMPQTRLYRDWLAFLTRTAPAQSVPIPCDQAQTNLLEESIAPHPDAVLYRSPVSDPGFLGVILNMSVQVSSLSYPAHARAIVPEFKVQIVLFFVEFHFFEWL